MQILHGELEASLQTAQEELITVHSKLEKQQQLNEKLENDLLEVEKHQHAQVNGMPEVRDGLKATGSSDALAGIELGKKLSVRISFSKPGYKTFPSDLLSVFARAVHPGTIHVNLCGCIHSAYCYKSTGSIQATKR